MARDRAEVEICFQLLIYPMLDDRTVLRTDHAGTGWRTRRWRAAYAGAPWKPAPRPAIGQRQDEPAAG